MLTPEFVARCIIALAGSVFTLAVVVGIMDRLVSDKPRDEQRDE